MLDKIVNELMDLYDEGVERMLLAYNKKGEITLNFTHDLKCIRSKYIIGEINLEFYNNADDIKEEILEMIEDYRN